MSVGFIVLWSGGIKRGKGRPQKTINGEGGRECACALSALLTHRPKMGLAAASTEARVLSTVVMPALAMEMVCCSMAWCFDVLMGWVDMGGEVGKEGCLNVCSEFDLWLCDPSRERLAARYYYTRSPPTDRQKHRQPLTGGTQTDPNHNHEHQHPLSSAPLPQRPQPPPPTIIHPAPPPTSTTTSTL